MSRFSLSEAKGLGWRFTEVADGQLASKELNLPSGLVTMNEFGETTGLVLERVFAYEAHLQRLGYYDQGR